MTNDQMIEEVFQNPRRFGLHTCFLCPSLPTYVGVLIADAEFGRRIDAAERHMVFYCLCADCFELEDRDQLVTQAVLVKHGLPAGGVQ